MPRMNERRRVAGALARKPVAKHVAEGVPGIDIGAFVTARRATELRPEIFDGPRYLTRALREISSVLTPPISPADLDRAVAGV